VLHLASQAIDGLSGLQSRQAVTTASGGRDKLGQRAREFALRCHWWRAKEKSL